MGINDVINKLSINNTHANLLHLKLIKRNLMNEQAKEIKNKVMCEINSFAIVYFFFDDRLFN
jgi:microsomal dipeptidase-like Zn-dependent dipeptidase